MLVRYRNQPTHSLEGVYLDQILRSRHQTKLRSRYEAAIETGNYATAKIISDQSMNAFVVFRLVDAILLISHRLLRCAVALIDPNHDVVKQQRVIILTLHSLLKPILFNL